MIELILPFPPSVNRYWRSPNKGKFAGRTLLSEAGRKYRAAALNALADQHPGKVIKGRVEVHLALFPPCRRKRDIDNYIKGVLDVLTHGRIWEDDEQVDRLSVIRGCPTKGGQIRVEITEFK